MIRQTQSTRVPYRWGKFVACIVIIICSSLLYWFLGDFPSGFWRFLGQVQRLPANGWSLAHLLPLVIPLLLVLIMLTVGIYLSMVVVKMCVLDWQKRRALHRHLQADRRIEAVAETSMHDAYVQQEGVRPQIQSDWQEQDTAPVSIPVSSTTRPLGENKNGKPADDVLLCATALSPAWPSPADQLTVGLPVAPQWSNNFHTTLSYQPPIDINQQNITLPDTDHLADEITQPLARVTKDRSITEPHTSLPKSRELEQGLTSNQSAYTYGHLEEEARLLIGVSRDVGIVRKDAPNEDAFFAFQGTRVTENESKLIGFFVVADGMGGHANGQEASDLAIQAMSDTVMPGVMRDVDGDDNLLGLLREGVHHANRILHLRNILRGSKMGTTLTAALVVGRKAYVVNVGDSRTYIYHNGAELLPVTRDHSFVAYMVERGLITRDRIYTHPARNQIYRSLGDHGEVEVDTFVEELHHGDALLLCSDGLWEMVRDSEIQKIVASADHPSQISNVLMQAALDHGGEDNISAIVVCMVYVEPAR